MQILQALAQLAAVVAKYGPIALAVDQFLVRHDWPGLLKYLTDLVSHPTGDGIPQKELQPIIDKLKGGLRACSAPNVI